MEPPVSEVDIPLAFGDSEVTMSALVPIFLEVNAVDDTQVPHQGKYTTIFQHREFSPAWRQ